MNTSFTTTSKHLLISILDELLKDGIQVTIIKKQIDGEEDTPVELFEKNIECIAIPFKNPRKKNLFARYIADVIYVLKSNKFLNVPYDAIFVQSSNVAGFSFFLLEKKQPKAKKTYNVQDIFPYNAAYAGTIKKNGLIFKIFEIEQKYAYKKADQIITISEDMKKTLMEDGVDGNKIDVIYNWSYQNEPYNVNSHEYCFVSNIYNKHFFNVVYAGNVGVMQNVDLFIDTAILMRNNKSVWFHVIGNGVYKDKLIKKAQENGVTNISFWPMQPAKLAPYIYSFADLNVIPLMKDVYKTALPSKTATCLLCGKPIVFAIGTNSEFGKKISDYHYVIDSDDPEQLKTIINDLIEGNASKKEMIVYSEFSKTRNSRLYADIICNMKGVIS